MEICHSNNSKGMVGEFAIFHSLGVIQTCDKAFSQRYRDEAVSKSQVFTSHENINMSVWRKAVCENE